MMAATLPFLEPFFVSLQVGEFVKYRPRESAETRIGRLARHPDTNALVVNRWMPVDDVDEGIRANRPDVRVQVAVPEVVQTLDFVSLQDIEIFDVAFVFHTKKLIEYKVRIVYGMMNAFCSSLALVGDSLQLLPNDFDVQPLLSSSSSLFDAVTRVSTEFQRILCNNRQMQRLSARATCTMDTISWAYFRSALDVPVYEASVVRSFGIPAGRDIAVSKLKVRFPLLCMRVSKVQSIRRLIGLLGVSCVIGMRARPPRVPVKLRRTGRDFALSRRATGVLDLVNFVDVPEQVDDRLPFSLSSDAPGIDLLFDEERKQMTIVVRYCDFVVRDVIGRIRDFGLASPTGDGPRRLNDDEIERLLQGHL